MSQLSFLNLALAVWLDRRKVYCEPQSTLRVSSSQGLDVLPLLQEHPILGLRTRLLHSSCSASPVIDRVVPRNCFRSGIFLVHVPFIIDILQCMHGYFGIIFSMSPRFRSGVIDRTLVRLLGDVPSQEHYEYTEQQPCSAIHFKYFFLV
jgi:hypothetical protein